MAEYRELNAVLAAVPAKYADVIRALPAADVVERPRWIPVEERLPEKGVDVLVFIGGEPYDRGFCTCASRDRLNEEWIPDFEIVEGHEIKAWMPLPEPPEE